MNKIKNSIEADVIRLLSHCIMEKVDPKNIQNHPIRVFEAAKSMIGLNLGNPSIILLDYMKTKKKSINFLHSELDTEKKAKTVSIYQLEEAINKNDYQESNKIIIDLLRLSDGKHILEYLLELCLKQSGKSLSIIWAIYKTLEFIGYSSSLKVRNSLLIATQALIYDEHYELGATKARSLDSIFDKSNLNDYELQVMGIIYEISSRNFIRGTFIKESLESFIKYFILNLREETLDMNDYEILPINNRQDLLKILEESKIDDRNILNINALRSYMKHSNKLNKKKLTNHILSIQNRT